MPIKAQFVPKPLSSLCPIMFMLKQKKTAFHHAVIIICKTSKIVVLGKLYQAMAFHPSLSSFSRSITSRTILASHLRFALLR